jgi:hypothetical protein
MPFSVCAICTGTMDHRCVEKEMHMIGLLVERAYDPGVCFADAADFLFNECSKLAYQNFFAVCVDTRQNERRACR